MRNLRKTLPILKWDAENEGNAIQGVTGMQITFGMYEDQERRKKASMLDEVAGVIDFGRIEMLLLKMYAHRGRQPIPPLMLFNALLLESWYGLSDVEVVQEIHARRSFERFIGVEVRKFHLDDTTLVKFRQRLVESACRPESKREDGTPVDADAGHTSWNKPTRITVCLMNSRSALK